MKEVIFILALLFFVSYLIEARPHRPTMPIPKLSKGEMLRLKRKCGRDVWIDEQGRVRCVEVKKKVKKNRGK
jgi:hypothetical protein